MTRFWPLRWMPGRVHHPYETLIYLSYRRSAGLRHPNCNGSCGGLSKAGKRRGACHCAPLWPVFAAAQVGELIKSTKKPKAKKAGALLEACSGMWLVAGWLGEVMPCVFGVAELEPLLARG